MAPSCNLVARSDEGSSAIGQSSLNVTMIIGIVVACVIVVGGGLWLAIHIYRGRQASKRDNRRTSAFLSVRGVVKEDQQTSEATT